MEPGTPDSIINNSTTHFIDDLAEVSHGLEPQVRRTPLCTGDPHPAPPHVGGSSLALKEPGLGLTREGQGGPTEH